MFDLQRVRKLINWLIFMDYGKNDAEIAQKLGYTKSSFSQILTGKVPISQNFVDKLCSLDENINKVWINGMGDMLKKSQTVFISDKIVSSNVGIPLIPVEAMAGYGNGDVQVMDYDIQENYIITPEFKDKGIKYLIRVSGSSMTPKYNNGDLLACRPVTDISFMQWGKVYVLDTEQGPLVKRLYPCEPGNENCLECRSDNYERYPPFIIEKSSIRRVAIVVGVLRLE